MKIKLSALVLTALVGSLSAGCGNAATVAPSQALASEACVNAQGRAGDHVYVFSAGSTSPHARVERTIRKNGSEALLGRTDFAFGKLMEYAELGSDGRLVYADVTFTGLSGASRRLIVDAEHGAFYTQDEHGSGWSRMPVETPVVYADMVGGEASSVAPTPVSAWITLRAAEQSENVRVLDAASRQTNLIPRDQLVTEGIGDERHVIAGETALTASGDFITSLGDAQASEVLEIASASLRPRRVAAR